MTRIRRDVTDEVRRDRGMRIRRDVTGDEDECGVMIRRDVTGDAVKGGT